MWLVIFTLATMLFLPVIFSFHFNSPFAPAVFKEIRRTYSKINFRNSANNFHDSSININTHIQLFSDCLVHLINYRNIDIQPKYPFIVSRYDVIKVTYENQNLKILPTVTQVRVYPHSSVPRNKSENIGYCSHYENDAHCNDFPTFDKTASAKLWNCEAHFYIYPPGRTQDPTLYEEDPLMGIRFLIIPSSFKHFLYHAVNLTESEKNHWNTLFNSKVKGFIISRAQYDLLIPEPGQGSDYVRSWSNSLTITRKGIFLTDFEFTPSNREMFVDFGECNYIWLCRYCSACASIGAFPLNSVKTLEDITSTISEHNSKNVGKIFWNIQVDHSFRRSLEKISKIPTGNTWEYLQLFSFHKRFKEHRKKEQRMVSKMRFDVEAMLLKSALVNLTSYSVNRLLHLLILGGTKSTSKSQPCGPGRFGVEPGIHTFASGTEDYFHFHFHPSRLKFVSCGNPSHTTLFQAFCQLIAIFDLPIWVGISLSVFSVGWAAYGFSFWYQSKYPHDNTNNSSKSLNSVFSSMLCFLKILFEQGDPINLRLISHHSPIRLLVGAFLIIGIVLSNAFKNENITHVTLPREPIPFDDLETLNLTGFKIYIRGTVYVTGVHRKSMAPFSTAAFWFLKNPFQTGNHSNVSNIFYNEVFSYGKGETSKSWHPWQWLPVASKPNRIVRIMNFNFTKLHPDWIEMLFYGTVSEYDVLKECNYTALFLPDVEANALYYRLKREGKSAFLGDHLGLSKDYGLMFARWVNPAVLKRIKSLYASGFYDWWTNFLVNVLIRIRGGSLHDNLIGETGRNKASDMQGNITVVFVILAMGLVCAVLVFCGEMWRKVKFLFCQRCYATCTRCRTRTEIMKWDSL